MPSVAKSFRYAWAGIRRAWREERNFRVEVFFAISAILLALWLDISTIHFILVIIVIVMVLTLEIVNTIFELLLDALKPRIHEFVAAIKDLMAGAVLIGSIGAFIVGFLVFWPYMRALIERFFGGMT